LVIELAKPELHLESKANHYPINKISIGRNSQMEPLTGYGYYAGVAFLLGAVWLFFEFFKKG
jgi:hypothetical protein